MKTFYLVINQWPTLILRATPEDDIRKSSLPPFHLNFLNAVFKYVCTYFRSSSMKKDQSWPYLKGNSKIKFEILHCKNFKMSLLQGPNQWEIVTSRITSTYVLWIKTPHLWQSTTCPFIELYFQIFWQFFTKTMISRSSNQIKKSLWVNKLPWQKQQSFLNNPNKPNKFHQDQRKGPFWWLRKSQRSPSCTCLYVCVCVCVWFLRNITLQIHIKHNFLQNP